ncbi:MAG: response regulator transcription factor [Bacteroidetes bacterium]|nr:response regulator transcription factor [Fibrella sp.]
MTISCIILDDEELAVHHLSRYIAKVPFLRLDAYFTDPSAAVNYLETNQSDLIFLDIEMPNFSLDGLDFVKIVGESQNYVFTTAYPEYAIKGYEHNVIDFLHKPFSFERFSKAVQKARQVLRLHSLKEGDGETDDHIYVKSEGKLQRIYFEDICWIQSERNYISIHTEHDRIITLMSISDIDRQLPAKLFARVHKSYIVAYKKVEFIEKDQIRVVRQQQKKLIALGEFYKQTFMQAIEQKTLKKSKPEG